MLPRLPYLSFLAVAAVTDIAIHGRGHPVSAKDLGKRFGLSDRSLEARLQALVRSGVLSGTRGPRGGYQLARETEKITVYDIVQAVADFDEIDWPDPDQSKLTEKVVKPALQQAEEALAVALSKITVAELAKAGERLHRQ